MERLLSELRLADDLALAPVDEHQTGHGVVRDHHDRFVGHEVHAVLVHLHRVERIVAGEMDLGLDGLRVGVIDHHAVGGLVEESGRARPDLALVRGEVRVVHVAHFHARDLVRVEVVDA